MMWEILKGLGFKEGTLWISRDYTRMIGVLAGDCMQGISETHMYLEPGICRGSQRQ